MFSLVRNAVRLGRAAVSAVPRRADVTVAALVLSATFLGCALFAHPAAAATPVPGGDGTPAALQKYVVGTQAWRESPWMTSPDCRERGGSFSLWAESVIADMPIILQEFNAELFDSRPRSAEEQRRNRVILDGYRTLSVDMQERVPRKFCVDDAKRWARTNTGIKPFGFEWGIEHGTSYSCTDSEDVGANKGSAKPAGWMGPERAPCDGFHIRCDGASWLIDQLRCAVWNVFSDRFVAGVEALRVRAINADPARGVALVAEKTPAWVKVAGATAALALVILAGWLIRRKLVLKRMNPPVESAVDKETDDVSAV